MLKKKRAKPQYVYTYSVMDELLASPDEPMPADFRRHQLTRMWEGLAAIERAPEPTTDDWRVCSDCVNLMETLTTMGPVKLCDGSVAEVQDNGLLQDAVAALAMAGKRHRTTGSIRMDAPGIKAVRAVLEDYAEIIDQLPARAMVRCHRLTERRIHQIMQGRIKPGDVVVVSM